MRPGGQGQPQSILTGQRPMMTQARPWNASGFQGGGYGTAGSGFRSGISGGHADLSSGVMEWLNRVMPQDWMSRLTPNMAASGGINSWISPTSAPNQAGLATLPSTFGLSANAPQDAATPNAIQNGPVFGGGLAGSPQMRAIANGPQFGGLIQSAIRG